MNKIFKSKIYWILQGIIALTFLLFWMHPDIFHTATSSNSLYLAKIKNFYDFNYDYNGGNDYLILIYLIFGVWNLPTIFFNNATFVNDENYIDKFLSLTAIPVEIIWWKLLLVIFFLASILFFKKLSEKLENQNNSSFLIFASSPILIYLIFAVSAYDILTVTIILFSLFFLFKKNLKIYSLIMGIAFSFKYFSLILFIPTILLFQKNILKILGYFFIFITPFIFQFYFFKDSEIFMNSFLVLFQKKVFETNLFILLLKFLGFTGYSILCIYAYFIFKEEKTDIKLNYVMFLSLFFVLFANIWHPQWLILIMPFFYFQYFQFKNKSLFLILEILIFISFFLYSSFYWRGNFDLDMFNNGAMSYLLPMSDSLFSLLNVDENYRYFNRYNLLLIFLFLSVPGLLLFTFLLSKKIPNKLKSIQQLKFNYLVILRLILLSIIILISFFSAFTNTKKLHREFFISSERDFFEFINEGNLFSQSFISVSSELKGISFFIQADNSFNNFIDLKLLHNDKLLYERMLTSDEIENGFNYVYFEAPLSGLKNEQLTLIINGDNVAIAMNYKKPRVFYNREKLSNLLVNNKRKPYDLVLKLLY